MKAFDKINEIFNKYELKPIIIDNKYSNIYQYLNDNPHNRTLYKSTKDDFYFINKYKNRIPKGHYGFSIGNPIIPIWCDIIEEIIDTCIDIDPNLQICQVKLKYGSICFYINTIIEDIIDIEIMIGDKLYDKNLIY